MTRDVADEQPTGHDAGQRGFWRGRYIAIGVAALISFAIGVMVGGSNGGDVGASPAIDLAREHGYALPFAQQPAFADGVVSQAEVDEAAGRFRVCVEDKQIAGFKFEQSENGWSTTYDSTDDFGEVQSCRIEHFDATYNVWRIQELDR